MEFHLFDSTPVDARRSPVEAGEALSTQAIDNDSVVAFLSQSTLPLGTPPGPAADDVQIASEESTSTMTQVRVNP